MMKIFFLTVFFLVSTFLRLDALAARHLNANSEKAYFPRLDFDIDNTNINSQPQSLSVLNKRYFSEYEKQLLLEPILYAGNYNQMHSQLVTTNNKNMSDNFFTENLKRPGVKQTGSGLQYRVIKEGSGNKPKSSASLVTVHYAGRLVDGREFDSSLKRGQPATFKLNQVIPGWTEGLQLMNEGAKYEFFIPANLAYGNNPPPGTIIDAGSTLVFEVLLLKVED